MLNQSVRPPACVVRLRGLDPDTLADCLEQVIAHVGDDESLPFLTCLQIRLEAGRLHAMATDRYTGAIASMPVRSSETARIIIPAPFARRMIEAMRPFGEGCGQQSPQSADLTITPTLLGLTVHFKTPATCWCDGLYEVESARLALRLDPDAETINLPALAAKLLAEPASTKPVPVDVRLLARFFTYGPIVPLETTTGRLMPAECDLLNRYGVHSTGRVIVLTRPDFLGFLAGCRTDPVPAEQRAVEVAETRTAWGEHLAHIA